jgi:cell division protein FtsB
MNDNEYCAILMTLFFAFGAFLGWWNRLAIGEQSRFELASAHIEDLLTIANQRTLLDKYDADNTALVQENAALKAREGELNSQVVRLIADKQELIEENAKLKAQVERLSSPVSDEEILEHMVYGEDGCDVAALIAARLAGKEEYHG